jgi:hypothetical protein
MPNISAEITFGIELECVRLTQQAASLIQTHGFGRHYDGSIRGTNGEQLPTTIEMGGGSEIVTPPYKVSVRMDNEGKHMRLDYGNAQNAIKAMCDCAAEINTSCGLHVHLGRPGKLGKSEWKPESVRTMLAICTLLEEKLFKLVPPSRHNNRHCQPIKGLFTANDLQSFYPTGAVVPRKNENPKRYCWLNLIETRRKGNDPRPHRMGSEATGTVEIRLLGNTRRFEYVWAWTQLWVKMAAYVCHLHPTFAFSHCVITDSIAAEMDAVLQAKNAVTNPDKTAEQREHPPEEINVTRSTIRRPGDRRQARPTTPMEMPRVPAHNETLDDGTEVVPETAAAAPANRPVTIRRGTNVERV